MNGIGFAKSIPFFCYFMYNTTAMKKWPVLIISSILAAAAVIWLLTSIVSGFDSSKAQSIDESTALADLLAPAIAPTPNVVNEVEATPSPAPSPTPAPTPSSMPEATPAPSPSPSPKVTASPEVTQSTPAPAEPVPNSNPVPAASGGGNYLSIENPTLPTVVTINSPLNLSGIIRTSSGTITHVHGEIIDPDGSVAQFCDFAPYKDNFSLAGTVNASLHFYNLAVGKYTYRVTATAQVNYENYEQVLVDQPFEIVAAGSSKSEEPRGGAGGYVSKLSGGTDNQSIIWDYFIQKFDNPYAVAGIMANIQAESSFNPGANQGDYTGDAHGFGLCQWTWERKDNLKSFADARGAEVNDLYMQLDFIMYELDNSFPSLKTYLQNATDGSSAAIQFCKVYEVSASTGKRGTFAETYLNKFALP